MKEINIIFLFLVFLASSVSAQGLLDTIPAFDYSEIKEYKIGGIEVSGAESRDRNAIKSIAGLQVGKTIKIPGDHIPKGVKALMRLRLFEDVQILQTKLEDELLFLEIILKERPTLSRHSFQGIKKVGHDDLNDILENTISKGSIVTEDVKELSRIKILEYYENKGFLNAKIKIKEFKDEKKENAVRLVFDIDRGDRVKIQELYFRGNEIVSSNKLRRKMKNTKRKKVLLKKSKYIVDDYKEDKNTIINYYNSIGYRNAKIVQDSIWKDAMGQMYIRLDIDEGDQFYLRNIVWKGNSKYTDDQLANIFGIFRGDVYNPDIIQSRLTFSQDGRDVSSLYLDDGYLFFTIDPVETAVVGDSIDLEMQIYEGPQATISDVIIKGNDRTHEHVIRRELRTKPGNKFSRSDIIRSQRELMNLGYFNPETMNIAPQVNQAQGTVDIVYELDETPSDQLELSAGYGGNQGLIGTLGLTFNNFSLRNFKDRSTWNPMPQGDGQKFSGRIQSNSRFFRSFNLVFTDPWLGGKRPNSFTAGFVASTYDYEILNSGKLGIYRFFTGLGSQLKWPDDFFSSSTTLSLEFLNLNRYNFGNFSVEDSNIETGNFKNFSIKQVISRSSIAEPIYPTRGSRVTLTLQFTPPYSLFRDTQGYTSEEVKTRVDDENRRRGSGNLMSESEEAQFVTGIQLSKKYEWIEYHKWRFDAEWYFSLVGKLVIAANAKMGFLGKYNDKLEIAPFERFELGGDGLSNQNAGITGRDIISLRGYETTDIDANRDGVGGATLFDKFTIEMRYPLSTNPSSTIYVHGFVQGGNAWSDFKKYNPFDLKRSAGFGMRIFLPMFGLLGFDYGWGIDKLSTNYGKFSIVLGFEPD